MREIKFRIWNNIVMEFHVPITINIFNGVFSGYTEKYDNVDLAEWYNLESGECVLNQYTGLKDKNGIEIYEGDIIKMYYHEKYSTFHEIVWNGFGWDANDFDNGDYYQGNDSRCHPWEKFEVVGNIYENPELKSD